jgi:hypothetical protein
MNFAPKAGPVVAELLSGIAALLIVYLAIHGPSFYGINSLSSGAMIVLVLVAWILGTFFDLIRNLFEYVWDCKWFTATKLNWAFFFRGDEKKLANLEHYFWSFYMLDGDMTVSIVLSIGASLVVLRLKAATVSCEIIIVWALLLFVALLFANDARLLRREIKDLLDAEPK